MFYLVVETKKGFKLVDYSDQQSYLFARLADVQNENPASQPVIMDEKALRAGFLVDGLGTVALDDGMFLVPLSEL